MIYWQFQRIRHKAIKDLLSLETDLRENHA